jgi:hypothetical protein
LKLILLRKLIKLPKGIPKNKESTTNISIENLDDVFVLDDIISSNNSGKECQINMMHLRSFRKGKIKIHCIKQCLLLEKIVKYHTRHQYLILRLKSLILL